jgi:hypothetical protein
LIVDRIDADFEDAEKERDRNNQISDMKLQISEIKKRANNMLFDSERAIDEAHESIKEKLDEICAKSKLLLKEKHEDILNHLTDLDAQVESKDESIG